MVCLRPCLKLRLSRIIRWTYNYTNEQHRFGEAGRLWAQAAEPGSEKWNQVRDELIALDFTINPTLTIYEASRDLMREMNADWQKEYTPPALWAVFSAITDITWFLLA